MDIGSWMMTEWWMVNGWMVVGGWKADGGQWVGRMMGYLLIVNDSN